MERRVFGERLYSRPCDVGWGLFAAAPIAAGALILEFTGRVLTLPEVRAKGPHAADALQIGLNRYLDLEEPGRLVNHSCRPNAVVRQNTRLVAATPIARDEEIRFDYSTTIADGWTMPCRCGVPECRGLVAAFLLLPDAIRHRYAALDAVQRFMIEELQA